MTLPRRLPQQVNADALDVVVGRMTAGARAGQSRNVRPADVLPLAKLAQLSGAIVVVIHGDDGTYPRPDAAVVYWIGAATPANALVFDFWYNETI